MTTIDTEHLAVANLLMTITERFLLEETLWADREARTHLHATANTLHNLAWQCLDNTADLTKAEAYAEAATKIIDNVVAARRFLTTLNH